MCIRDSGTAAQSRLRAREAAAPFESQRRLRSVRALPGAGGGAREADRERLDVTEGEALHDVGAVGAELVRGADGALVAEGLAQHVVRCHRGRSAAGASIGSARVQEGCGPNQGRGKGCTSERRCGSSAWAAVPRLVTTKRRLRLVGSRRAQCATNTRSGSGKIFRSA
eukprot:5140861-Prymnesium_polylepis.1